MGIEACAITDHSYLGGIIEFYKEAVKVGVKPLIGVEAYITEDADKLEKKTRDNHHLVIIAKNQDGYRKLLRAQSNAGLNNHYYKARIYRENLKELAPDVVISSACLASPFSKRARYLIDEEGVCQACCDSEGLVEKELDWYLSVFGEDFYLELQDAPAADKLQEHYNALLLVLGRAKGVPFTITSDAHYLTKEDHALHELMIAMQLGMTIQQYKDQDSMRYGNFYYVKSPEEMKQSAEELGIPEAIDNTNDIAEKCNVEIELGKYKFPSYDLKSASDYGEFKKWQRRREKSLK
jgi:DNA polymerase-3 subunit alpha